MATRGRMWGEKWVRERVGARRRESERERCVEEEEEAHCRNKKVR